VKVETPDFPAPPIESYGSNGFRIAGDWRDGAITLRGSEIDPWNAPTLGALTVGHFSQWLEGDTPPEMILIGSGDSVIWPPETFRHQLLEKRIGLEICPTAPACRLYNVLLEQGRDVGAALMPVAHGDGDD